MTTTTTQAEARKPKLLRTRAGTVAGYTRARINVYGGLHRLGEQAPYFTLTADILRGGGHMVAGGCMHREILALWPELADLAALHLSDCNGVPMHAEANGWYQLAGALGGMGEEYHAGNAKGQRWKPDGTFDGYREPTRDECMESFAEHCRIPHAEAAELARTIALSGEPRKAWARSCEAMRPRWKREAEACIEKHGLYTFAD